MSTFKANQWVRLTKTSIEKLPIPDQGQVLYRDRDLKGFGLRITAGGTRSFILEKRIEGKVKRQTLGRYGELTCDQARKKALALLGQIAMGLNPIREREKDRMGRITLGDVFEDFLKTRRHLKEKTRYDYQRLIEGPLSDWQARPVKSITRRQILDRHAAIGGSGRERYANLTMRFLSSLFNFAMAHYQDGFGEPLLADNPVKILSQTKAWYRAERRRTVIKVHQLTDWYQTIEASRHTGPQAETVADLLLLMILTGLRRSEAVTLTWDQIDLADASLVIPDPKNRQPHELPLSDYLVALLERRKIQAINAYVFPGTGRSGHLVDPKKQIARLAASSGVPFSLHDLRRTFATVAESLEISPYTVKRLLNHKMANDVTAGYIISDLERLRAPIQRITDFFLYAMGANEERKVLPFNTRL